MANKQGGGGAAKKAREGGAETSTITFADVAGVDEAKVGAVQGDPGLKALGFSS